jgi:hypothetical protein
MFRFTIRDVLWLTVVAALAIGWWLDHRRATRMEASYVDLMHRNTSLVEQLDGRGISVFIDPAGSGVFVMEQAATEPTHLPSTPTTIVPPVRQPPRGNGR